MAAPPHQQQPMSFYSQQNIPAAQQYAQQPYHQQDMYQNMAPQNDAMLYKSPSQPHIQQPPAGTVQAGQALIYTGQSQFHFKGQPMQSSPQVMTNQSDQHMGSFQTVNPPYHQQQQQQVPMGSQPMMMTYGGMQQPTQNQNYVTIPQANPTAYGGQSQRNISVKQQTPTPDGLAPMNLPKEPGLEMMSRASRTSESKIPLAKRVSMQETDVHDPPSFTESLTESINVTEGEVVNLMISVEPSIDSSLTVEWYKDGQPLKAGSRFNNSFDRGYATLDILFAHPEDSGVYTCVATSKYGSCNSTECRITVNPEAQLQHVPDYWSQSAPSGLSRFKPGDDSDHYPPPRFLQQLQPHMNLKENAPVHLETKVTPIDDPSLTVEWFKNGKAMSTGCRFNNTFDRGYAILDIYYVFSEDNGLYYCRATSKSGTAQTDPVEIQ